MCEGGCRHLQEGDVLILRGTRFLSAVIAGVSSGWSHVAIVVRMRGELCFCHATPNPAQLYDVIAGAPISGVVLTRACDEIRSGFYSSAVVCRSDAFRVDALRAYLATHYGMPYEKNLCALLCAGGGCGDGIDTPGSIFCTELAASVLGMERSNGMNPEQLRRALAHVGYLRLPPPRCATYFCNCYQSPSLDMHGRRSGRLQFVDLR